MPLSLLTQEIDAKYEILHKLAEGGMGAVYKVRHRLLDEVRVIKVIRSQHKESKSLRARFKSEAQAAIRLRHPNVAQVYDFAAIEDGSAYLVMEYIEGMTLKQFLAHSGPPPQASPSRSPARASRPWGISISRGTSTATSPPTTSCC